MYQIDGVGFFSLESTFFWLTVIFSFFDSVFVFIGPLILVIANVGKISYDYSRNDQFLRKIDIIILIVVYLFTEYPKDFTLQGKY